MRSLENTKELSMLLFNQEIEIISKLAVVIDWTWLVGIIAVSCVIGICFLLSMLRSFQHAAQLPTTKCSEWGNWGAWLSTHLQQEQHHYSA